MRDRQEGDPFRKMGHDGGNADGPLAGAPGSEHVHCAGVPPGDRRSRGGTEGRTHQGAPDAACHPEIAPGGRQDRSALPGPDRRQERPRQERDQRGNDHRFPGCPLEPGLQRHPAHPGADLRLGGRHHPGHHAGRHGAGSETQDPGDGDQVGRTAPDRRCPDRLCQTQGSQGKSRILPDPEQGGQAPRVGPRGRTQQLPDHLGHQGRPAQDDADHREDRQADAPDPDQGQHRGDHQGYGPEPGDPVGRHVRPQGRQRQPLHHPGRFGRIGRAAGKRPVGGLYAHLRNQRNQRPGLRRQLPRRRTAP